MGWLYTHRAPGAYTDLAWFQKEVSPHIKEGATIDGVFYGLYEIKVEEDANLVRDENGLVRLALVILTRRVPKDHYNFGWKSMDEFSGPCEVACPLRILDKLSPFTPSYPADGYARRWRAEARQHAEKMTHLVTGAVFRSKQPLKFGDGVEDDTFRILQRQGRKLVWQRQVDHARVLIDRHALLRLEYVS